MIKLLKFIRTNWITHANTRNHTYRQIKRKTWQFAVGAQLQLTNASWETMMHDDNFCVGDAMTLRRPWRFYDVAGDLVTTVKSQWCRRRPCDDREESMMSQTTLTNPRCRWRGPVTVAFQEGHGSDEAWSQSRNKTLYGRRVTKSLSSILFRKIIIKIIPPTYIQTPNTRKDNIHSVRVTNCEYYWQF